MGGCEDWKTFGFFQSTGAPRRKGMAGGGGEEAKSSSKVGANGGGLKGELGKAGGAKAPNLDEVERGERAKLPPLRIKKATNSKVSAVTFGELN